MTNRHYVPDGPNMDARVVYNNATAMVVGMMRATEGFSIRNQEDRQIALQALNEMVSGITKVVVSGADRSNEYAD